MGISSHVRIHECEDCGVLYIAGHRAHKCRACYNIYRRDMKAGYQNKYHVLGKDREGKKRYAQSEKGREIHRKANRKYDYSEKGIETRRLYLESDLGRAYLKRTRYKRYIDRYQDFVIFKREAFRDRLPCVYCGKHWIDGARGVGHEIDHILALCNGGTHLTSNLQVLCYGCHLITTKIDRNDMNARKTVWADIDLEV